MAEVLEALPVHHDPSESGVELEYLQEDCIRQTESSVTLKTAWGNPDYTVPAPTSYYSERIVDLEFYDLLFVFSCCIGIYN